MLILELFVIVLYIYIYILHIYYIILYIIACHTFCGECTGSSYTDCKLNKCTKLIPYIAMIEDYKCWCDNPYFLNETNNCEGIYILININNRMPYIM